MTIRKTYQWERFWCPTTGSYSLDNAGFLVDPKSELGKYYSSTALTFDEIPTTSCLVLLGESGIGKTKALEDAFNSYPSNDQFRALWLDLRSYTSDIGLISGIGSNPAIQDWINGDYRLALFLDSLDEGMLNVKTIAALLLDLIRQWPRKKLEIKFACRTSDWPKLLDNELRLLFDLPEIPKYELLPLRKVDVEAAANAEGIDANLFITAVQNAEAAPFANRPVTLNFLLNSYKVYGRLSEYKSEIYWQGCVQLCSERNESRHASRQIGKLMPSQRILVAARISALMMFSNKYAVWTDIEGNIANEDLSINSLLGFSEIADGIEFAIDSDAVKETLGTGLFNSRGESRIGFSHQTYLEYLAAYYLIQKRVPFESILGLITYSDGKIIPQLREVAIWLATFSETVFTALFDVQADILLRVPKGTLTTNKKKFIGKLLVQYESGRLIDDYELIKHFNRLDYSGIADQLHPYLDDKDKNFEVRRVTILIARECRVVELVNTLVSVALDQNEDQALREYAAYTVCDIGDENACMLLMPLALGKAGADPQDELKGVGLKAVWGRQEIITDLLESITPVKNENLIGTYYHFLSYEFSELVRVEHLAEVLNWLLVRGTNFGNEILESAMIHGVMLRAWHHFDDPQIAAPFSKLVYKRLLGHQEGRTTTYDKTYITELSGNSVKRRNLVGRVIDLMNSSKEAFYLSYNPNFLFRDDVDWIIENIERTNKSTKCEIWAQLLFDLTDIRNQDDLSKVYGVYEKYPEIRAVFSKIFEPIELNNELAKHMRDYENQSKTIEQARAEKPINQVNHHSQLLLYIDQFNEGDVDAWWKLNLLFLGSDPGKGGHEFDSDITSFALWDNIDYITRDSLVLIAQNYLVQHSGGEIYLDDNRIYRPAVSAFRALYLIAIKKSEAIDNMSPDIWSKWASVILSYPVFDNKSSLAIHQVLISKLIQVSEKQFYDLLREQIVKEEKSSQYLRVLKLIEHLDTQKLQDVLVDVLETENISPSSFGQILQFLLERNNPVAKHISLEFVLSEASDSDEGVFFQKRFQAARSLMLYSQDAGWPVIGNQVKADEKFGEHLFQSLAFNRDHLAGVLAGKISESSVAELYVWLENRFPEVDDPDVGGFHAVSERESVGQFRDSLIRMLADKGNEQACLCLEQLIVKYPEKSNLPYYLRICEEKTRRNDWIPREPYVVLEITRNAYLEYLNNLRKKQNDLRMKQNFALALVSMLANIFIIVLPGVVDYENNIFFSFLASHQVWTITILIISTVILAFANLNRPITE